VNGEMLIFFILALTTIGGAVLMLNLSKVVHMLVALAFTFISIAGLFFMLEAEFIAVAQILIYGGAVSIIMLFGIMLTRHLDHDETRRNSHKWLAMIGVVLFFGVTFFAINGIDWAPQESALFVDNTAQIGVMLFAHYVIPFELTSIVLLVALIGAVILARRDDAPQTASASGGGTGDGKEGDTHD
jgi:NADH-quinone oxidoreductase subunit J